MIDKVNQLVAKLHLFMKQSPGMHYNAKVLFDAMKGEHKIAEIHYALARMKDFKYVHRVKHGVYQLTTIDKPIEKMFSKKRLKARKPRTPKYTAPTLTLSEQVKKWDEQESRVDFKDLCQKLQNALAKAYVDCDLLEATVSEQRTIIKYLESKVRETATV